MKYAAYLLLTLTLSLISCKSKNEKKADQLIENLDHLKLELINSKNITRDLLNSYYASIKTISDSVKVVSRDKKIKEIRNTMDEKLKAVNHVLDSIVGIYSTNIIKGDYEGLGKVLFLLKGYGYVDFGFMTTKISILSQGKIDLRAESSFHEVESLSIKLVNIVNKGDSLISGDCWNIDDANAYCTFTWRKNRIILSRTYQTNATGEWQTLTWESINTLKGLNNISNEKASSNGENNSQLEDNQEIFTISDPDGYTNVREGKNSKSKILFKISEGDEFHIKSKDTDWWEIEFNDKTGFVHKSRIIPVGEE